jgi:tetratricopeptide (TPR) repeat protein
MVIAITLMPPWSITQSVLDTTLGLDLSRREAQYDAAMESAYKALKKEPADLETALQACAEAEGIMGHTTATRVFRKKIIDDRYVRDLVRYGDTVLLWRRYQDALHAYEEAIVLQPSPDLEEKVRIARALLLMDKARDAMEKGDTAAALRNIESSIWNHSTPEALSLREEIRAFMHR